MRERGEPPIGSNVSVAPFHHKANQALSLYTFSRLMSIGAPDLVANTELVSLFMRQTRSSAQKIYYLEKIIYKKEIKPFDS